MRWQDVGLIRWARVSDRYLLVAFRACVDEEGVEGKPAGSFACE